MKTLWFVMPVHGRIELAAICLRQLRITCDSLLPHGIEATAVVIADRENMSALKRKLASTDKSGDERYMLGFGTIIRDNDFLSRRFNDGFQLAMDPRWNPRPAHYVVPIGSDDWIDYNLLLNLPDKNTVVGFRNLSVVREDGHEIVARVIEYDGGAGMRIYPRELLQKLDFRPADEDRKRGCDTSILNNIKGFFPKLAVINREIDPRQLVDWKSSVQLNSSSALARHRGEPLGNPFRVLADLYPHESLKAMKRFYAKLCDERAASSPATRSSIRRIGATIPARSSMRQ